MAPDLHVFSRPVRYLILAVLGGSVALFALLVLLGLASTPTTTLDAAVVDSVPADSDAEVYPLSTFPAESPIRTVVEEALRNGSASVRTTTEAVRSADVSIPTFYVRDDGRIVRVSVDAD
jgi:hypothetical protein